MDGVVTIQQTPNGLQIGPIKVPVANTYDVDNEYDYIMTRALKSYKLHRDKERADNRQKQLKSAYRRRWQTTRRIQSAGPEREGKSPATIRSYSSRPTSAIPSQMDAIREVSQANDVDERINKLVKRPIDLKLVTLPMEESPKGIAFQKRNQTSQAWYSHSFPSGGFLNNTMRLQCSANSQTGSSTSRTEEKSSRPESARSKYEYDGGIFDTSNYPRKEYFVIHPDWVSEAMTIQKLSLNDRKPVMSSSWPGRRCKSAPPPKYRNIITWENRT